MSEEFEFENKTYGGPIPRIKATDEFIEKQNFKLNRSIDEIRAKIAEESKQAFGFTSEVLIKYLPFMYAKDYLKKEYVEKVESGKEKWNRIVNPREATQDMLDYFVFGLGKALDERGISASRTLDKLRGWAWLLGRDDLHLILSGDNYNPYGMPILIEFGEKIGIEVSKECHDFAKVKC